MANREPGGISDFILALREGILTEWEQLVHNPSKMYDNYRELFKWTEKYRESEGIRKGLVSGRPEPRVVSTFQSKPYFGKFENLVIELDLRWKKCEYYARILSDNHAIFDEYISPEKLILGVIENKRRGIRKKLDDLEAQGAVPRLKDLGLEAYMTKPKKLKKPEQLKMNI